MHGQPSMQEMGRGDSYDSTSYEAIGLGLVETEEDITEQQRQQLKTSLLRSGLELLDDKKSILIEKKTVIVE